MKMAQFALNKNEISKVISKILKMIKKAVKPFTDVRTVEEIVILHPYGSQVDETKFLSNLESLAWASSYLQLNIIRLIQSIPGPSQNERESIVHDNKKLA